MLPKIECSDELLLGILNQDPECSTKLGLRHLDNCEHCQARIEELAANEQQWTLAREGLCSREEDGLDVESPTRLFRAAEHSSDWTDTMAKQLLQPPSHPEMLGRLGRYEIERLVGSGGMGVVFKAYDSELHRSVAIKMLAPHLSGSRSARERFAREARAAAAIVNDHVVPIHNVETEHATPYLVMQYIAGDSLQARLDRDGPLDVCEILRIGMQVATGLAAAHAQGLIHRDVKPSNIMLDENVARALLTDFGLARTQDEACLTRSGFHPGTPHYMSPEQVRGEELDGRSDLFSLGCVLYALCTGHPPYRADSGYAVMRRITDEQPRSIREQNAVIPEWLERLVIRLLEKDRESRFQSAEELAQILEQCLAHVQKPATEPLPLAVVHKASFFDRGRIRNWILAGMASAFLFFAGVFIVLETNKGTITIKSEADNVPIRIKRSDQVVDEMLVSRTGKSIRLAAGEYVIEFDGDSQDLVVEGGNVSLVRGDTKTLQIVYKKSDSDETRMSKKSQTRVVYEKAIEESEQRVASAPENNEFARDLAVAYSAMGDLFLSESNRPESRKYYEKALEVFERIVAAAPETAQYARDLSVANDKMGDLLRSQGDGAQAREYYERAREIRERLASAPTSATSESTWKENDGRVLSAISRLIVPATINLNQDLGVVTVNGSKADVERTNRIIDIIRKTADEKALSRFIERPASETKSSEKDQRILSAIPRLDAPATITVDDENGIVTIKGSQAAVEKTTRMIEMIRKVAQEQPNSPIDWTKLNAEVPVVESELAIAVNEFNRNEKNWWALWLANSPLFTEDELCAALWFQANHTNISNDVRKQFLAIVLERKLPAGWSIRLSGRQWDIEKQWSYAPGTSSAIEINLMQGNQVVSTIRSQFASSGLSSQERANSPLADAINQFNKEQAGVEPPLTLEEVLAALTELWSKKPDQLSESHNLTDEAISKFKQLADQHTMEGVRIDSSLHDHQVGDSKFLTWTIDLLLEPSKGKLPYQLQIRKRFIQVESDRISARMKEPTAPHADKTPTPLLDFSKVNISTHESDLTAAVDEFNKLHSEKLRASNLPPLTEDEFVASLWWQYSQSKLREEIIDTVVGIVLNRKLPPGWSIKLNTRSWTLPQQWWHDKPLTSSATQIDLIGNEGLATTIRNQFVSSDISSIRPPESALEKAIAEFNKAHSEEGPELTLDETLAALSTLWVTQSWYSYDGLKPTTMDTLMAVIDRHEMKGVKIKLLHSYQTAEEDRFDVSAIRLEVQSDQDGSSQAFTIRERFEKVNSFSDETIHWGKPSDEGLQAGFRLKPTQTRYLAGQVVDVEFFYRSIHGKGLTATIPAAFHFNKIEIDVLDGDGKQRLTVEHDREKIIGGWRAEEIGEQPKLFKNRKIRFVDSPENLAAAKQIPDDWTTNVMLPINTKCDITFDVPDFADIAKKPASLLTGSTQLMILNGSDDKRQLGIAPDASETPWDKHVGAKTAGTKDSKSLPSLLKQREDVVQRAFLAAKANYEAGLIGIDPFSEWVAELIQAKFATRTAADGHAEPQAAASQDDATIMLIEEFFVKQKTLGDNHPELLPLRDKVLKLGFDHAFDEAGIQKRLLELNRERQQLLNTLSEGHPSLRENSLRKEAVASLRSGSFPKMLKMLVETDPRRAKLLPQEWKGKWVVENATTGDGSPLDIAKGSTLSIFNSTIDWHWGEQAREAYVVNGVTVNGRQSLVDLHWRAESPNMLGGAATGDVQWVVEYRDNKLWIVRLDQPESPVPDSVDNIRPGHTRFILKRAEPYSLSDDTIQLRKEVERLKTTVRGLQSQEKQVTHVRQLPFPKEMQGVWRIKEAFKGVVEKNGRTALAQYENQIVTISDSTMFLQSNVVGNYWYLSRLDSSSSPMQVDLSVWSGSDSVYKTFACLLEIQDNKLCLVRAESPGFPRPQSVQELRRGETCFVMTRIGDSPMTPEEVIQVAKKKVFEKEDRTVRFKVESVHAPFVLGEPSEGHREGELHLDCRPDPHDFSLDQFLVVLTAECQKKLHGEGVEDITKHFLGKTITAKGPVRGVEYTARAMKGEHFHLIVDDPSKLIIGKSE